MNRVVIVSTSWLALSLAVGCSHVLGFKDGHLSENGGTGQGGGGGGGEDAGGTSGSEKGGKSSTGGRSSTTTGGSLPKGGSSATGGTSATPGTPVTPVINALGPTNLQTVTVTGTADAGTTVQLSDGGVEVTDGSAVTNASGVWSIAIKPTEGSHPLTAVATGSGGLKSAVSTEVTLVVDRTAPTVNSQVPANGATGVAASDTIQVVFSEPLALNSVTNSSVFLSSSAASGGSIAEVLDLSSDGRTLTIKYASAPIVPSTISATLSTSLTDLAGNALALNTWSWSLPDWLNLDAIGGQSSQMKQTYPPKYDLAIDGNRNLYSAVYFLGLAAAGIGTLSKIDGKTSTALSSCGVASGVTTPPTPPVGYSGPSITLDQNANVVWGWIQKPGDAYVGRVDATACTVFGDKVNSTATAVKQAPVVRVNSAGEPTIAYLDVVSTVQHLFVSRYSNTTKTWTLYREYSGGATTGVTEFSMALDSNGTPIIALNDGASISFAIGTCGPVVISATDAQGGAEPSVTVDKTNYPIIAYKNASGVVTVRRATTTCPVVGSTTVLGTVASGTSTTPTIVRDSKGNLVIAYMDTSAASASISVKTSVDQVNWSTLGTFPLGTPGGKLSLAVGPSGQLGLEWGDFSYYSPLMSTWQLHVRRYNN